MRWISIIWIAALFLVACSPNTPAEPRIQVENARVSPVLVNMPGMSSEMNMPGMANGMEMSGMSGGDATTAGYLVIANDGNAPDTLLGVSVSSLDAMSVQLHETRIDNGIASMVPISQIELPPHSRVEFKPGGRHMMFVGIKHDLTTGMKIQVAMQFAKSGTYIVNVPVQPEPTP